MSSYSASADEALRHLKILKPLDGWAIEKVESKGYRLLRRNVPLTDNFFLDIHYEATPEISAVVGILTKKDARRGTAQAQLLVDRHGRTVGRQIALVTVHTWESGNSRSSSSTTTTTTPRSATNTTAATSATSNTTQQLTDEQNMQLIKYVGGAIFGLTFLRMLVQSMSGMLVIALPLIFLYLIPRCPSNASFDAKKELKRVMRGYHLPDGDPNKPKGFLSETYARLNAAVTTELATGLGYEVTFTNIAQAATVVCVRVPAGKMDFYWVGLDHKWFYVYFRQVENE